MPGITVLAGGVGGSRFVRGLVRALEKETSRWTPGDVTVVANVADDVVRHGLRVCPDLDTLTYTLSGVVHPKQQWGRAEESFTVAEELERFGETRWFTLGDRDLATHIYRTMRLDEGASLSRVTAEITAAFGVPVRVLPATDQRVETRIHTTDGEVLHFQEYWVGRRAQPSVAGIELAGAEDARPAEGVVEAILEADVVLLAPSNPVVSVGTILDVPGVRPAVLATSAPVVGVSPIVGGGVLCGMADRLLPAIGVDVSAAGVAHHYGDVIDGWVFDEIDADVGEQLPAGTVGRCTNTIMDDVDVAAALARACLSLGDELRVAATA